MNYLFLVFNALFKCKEIVNCDRDLYLTRWYLLRFKSFAVFLHYFHRSDEDRALHDHPWNFITIPLWRGYYEHTKPIVFCRECYGEGSVWHSERCQWDWCRGCGGSGARLEARRQRIYPLMVCYRPATWRHRVELVKEGFTTKPSESTGKRQPIEKPALTLVIRFREWRDWGFWTKGGFINWRVFWERNCE